MNLRIAAGTTLVALSLLSNPPRIFGAPSPTASHKLMLLNSGAADLEMRLRMIEQAQESIEIETFAFCEDRVGVALLKAVVKRQAELKKQGKQLKARILVDGGAYASSTPDLDPEMIKKLKAHGVEVKYFNKGRAQDSLGAFIARDTRTHRKIFIVDDKQMIAGGRNIGEADFGLGKGVNYVDIGTFVEGPASRTTREAFDSFWNSELAIGGETIDSLAKENQDSYLANPFSPFASTYQSRAKAGSRPRNEVVEELLKDAANEDHFVQQIRARGAQEISSSPTIAASEVIPVVARPEVTRQTTPVAEEFHRLMGSANQSVLLENYLYIPTNAQKGVEKKLLGKGVDVTLLTNGIDSAGEWKDHWELSFPYQAEAVKQGMKIFAFRGGLPVTEATDAHGKPSSNWMIHSKILVVDGKTTWVGTNNMDPRSENLNAEWAIIVRDNPEFAAEVAKRIKANLKDADEVTADGLYARKAELEAVPCVDYIQPTYAVEPGVMNWMSNLVGTVVRKHITYGEY